MAISRLKVTITLWEVYVFSGTSHLNRFEVPSCIATTMWGNMMVFLVEKTLQ